MSEPTDIQIGNYRWPLPTVYSLHRLALAQARATVHPRVLVYGDTPADAESRDVPYLIIDPDPGFDTVARADGRVSSRRGRFSVRCCGSTPAQAALALDACRDLAFRDWRPYGGDLRFGMARESDAGPLVEDKSIPTDVRYSFTVVYDVDDD